jgi:predicted nucleotidyltransferase
MDHNSIQPLLDIVKHDIYQLYRERLNSVYLFGSYARGEATEQSDIDLLVVLNDNAISPFTEIGVMGEITYRVSLTYDKLVTVVPVTKQRFDRIASPLYKTVKLEGRQL